MQNGIAISTSFGEISFRIGVDGWMFFFVMFLLAKMFGPLFFLQFVCEAHAVRAYIANGRAQWINKAQ